MTANILPTDKKCIGSKEFISFPQLNKRNITARIDTGAKTSSIHCEKVWIERVKNKKVLCASLLKKTTHITKFPKFRLKKIKSSNGHVQMRFIVKLMVEFSGDVFETEFTLSNRDKMNHAVLLGRKFLKNRYIVDVSRMYIYSSKKKKI
jgi:hypothetical protein